MNMSHIMVSKLYIIVSKYYYAVSVPVIKFTWIWRKMISWTMTASPTLINIFSRELLMKVHGLQNTCNHLKTMV